MNPYVLQAQSHELVDDDLHGRAALTLVSKSDGIVVGASLTVSRALIDDAALRPRADALLGAFLARIQSPLGLQHPVISEVWSGGVAEREQTVRGRVLMAERVPAFGGQAVRVSWQEAPRVERACRGCGGGNLDSYAFCAHCGQPRGAAGRLQLTPPPPPPPPMPIPVEGPPPLDETSTIPVQVREAPADGGTEVAPISAESADIGPEVEPLLEESPTIPVAIAPPKGMPVLKDPPTIPVMLMEKLGSTSPPVLTEPPMIPVLQDPPTIPVRKSISHNPFVPIAPPGVTSVADAWTAPEPLPSKPAPLHDHRGDAVRPSDDLFVGAPPEIGEVRSAATSISRGQDRLWRRFLRTLPWALPAAGLAWAAVEYGVLRFVKPDPASLALYRWIAPSLVFLLVAWLRLPTRRVLSYVGSKGVALCDVRFRVWAPRQPPVGVLEFSRARDLTVAIGHQRNCLEFAYLWRGHDGRDLLRLARRYKATPDGQRPLDPGEARFYDFCRAAERSWTLFVVEAAKAAIRRGDSVSFPVYSPNCSELRVHDGNLVFRLASGEAVVPASLLEHVAVRGGKVHFTPEEGDISLPCADIGNVTVLLLVMQHYLGVAVR